jgi:hypothetical protein
MRRDWLRRIRNRSNLRHALIARGHVSIPHETEDAEAFDRHVVTLLTDDLVMQMPEHFDLADEAPVAEAPQPEFKGDGGRSGGAGAEASWDPQAEVRAMAAAIPVADLDEGPQTVEVEGVPVPEPIAAEPPAPTPDYGVSSDASFSAEVVRPTDN